MTTLELCTKISKQTNIPITKVSMVINHYCSDLRTIVSFTNAGSIAIPNIGRIASKNASCLKEMDRLLRVMNSILTKNFDKFKEHKPFFRLMFTEYCDRFYIMATTVNESKTLIGPYSKGYGCKKLRSYDEELFKGYLARMDAILEALPTTLARSEPNKIQKVIMRKMSKKGVLLYPKTKDCQVHPLSLYDKSKNTLS